MRSRGEFPWGSRLKEFRAPQDRCSACRFVAGWPSALRTPTWAKSHSASDEERPCSINRVSCRALEKLHPDVIPENPTASDSSVFVPRTPSRLALYGCVGSADAGQLGARAQSSLRPSFRGTGHDGTALLRRGPVPPAGPAKVVTRPEDNNCPRGGEQQ
ncbi:hypothetical protein MRX96_027553 [Rhipicephalus microplus]